MYKISTVTQAIEVKRGDLSQGGKMWNKIGRGPCINAPHVTSYPRELETEDSTVSTLLGRFILLTFLLPQSH